MAGSESAVALLVGASGEIGEAVARRLAKSHQLHLTGWRRMDRVERLAEELGATAQVLDLSKQQEVETVVATVVQRSGRLDLLINCAGVIHEAPALGVDDQDWQVVIETNLTGAFRLCRAAGKPMLLARSGCMVNVSSTLATRGGRGQIAYAAAKSGLDALTRVLAIELGRRNIRVNGVAPGCIETHLTARVRELHGEAIRERIALGRLGSPDDVARVIEFLASPQAAYLTGQVLRVDGGMDL